jgi:hypothetical protein
MSTRLHYLRAVCLLLPIAAWIVLYWLNAPLVSLMRLYALGVCAHGAWSLHRWSAAFTLPLLAVALGLVGLIALPFRDGSDWWPFFAIGALVEFGPPAFLGAALGVWGAANFPNRRQASRSHPPSGDHIEGGLS